MRCSQCGFYMRGKDICIKWKEGKMSEMDTDCLLRYMIQQLHEIIEYISPEEEEV